MRTLKAALSLLTVLVLTSSTLAASVAKTTGRDGKDRLVMDNGLVRLQIDPNRGGRVDSLQYRPWGKIDIIQDTGQQGLFVDHFWQELWPGQFWEARYEHEVVATGPGEVAVRLSCLSKNKGVPQVAGILVEKTITLKEKDPTVYVTVHLTNKTAKGRYVGYWMQNVCWLGGDKEGDQYFRPTKRGVSQTSSDDPSPPDAGFVREPQAGWTAAIDRKTRTGLVFFMDYNQLWFLYNCTGASTIEWQYDAVAIPPGKTWRTEVSLVPTARITAIRYASRELLADVQCHEDTAAGKLAASLTYVATRGVLPSIGTQVSLETLLSRRVEKAGRPVHLMNVGAEPKTASVLLPYDTRKREPAVVRMQIRGKGADGREFAAQPEFWYGGSMVSNTNLTDGSPFYAIPSPRKTRTLIKPDRIARIKGPTPRVLYLKGLLSPAYRIEETIAKVDPNAAIMTGYAYNGVFGPQLDYFPYDYDALMGSDLVIIGDLSAAHLGSGAMEMLKDYCQHGGNLLVLGGPLAYGNGGYKGTVMDDILPVRSQGPFDLVATKSTETGDDTATLMPGYVHRVVAKPAAKVLQACGEYPLLIAGSCGEGKIICFTGTPMGPSNYCGSPLWQRALTEVLKDLGLGQR